MVPWSPKNAFITHDLVFHSEFDVELDKYNSEKYSYLPTEWSPESYFRCNKSFNPRIAAKLKVKTNSSIYRMRMPKQIDYLPLFDMEHSVNTAQYRPSTEHARQYAP